MSNFPLSPIALAALLISLAAAAHPAAAVPPPLSLLPPGPAEPIGCSSCSLLPESGLALSGLDAAAATGRPVTRVGEAPWRLAQACSDSMGADAAGGGCEDAAETRPETKGLWRWPRTGAAGYAGIVLFGAGAALVESEYGRPQAKWKGHNGFDDSIRDALRLGSREDRETARNIGDLLMWGMIAAPVLDSFATLGVRDGDWDAQWQTQMVNLESFAFTSLISAGVQTLVAREKPFVRNCQNGVCEGDNKNRSMPSGHAAFAFTGAGLVCSHHHYQALYHDPAADTAACATGLVLAAADGVVRIMADHHYASDVLAGSAIGLFSGFLLPRLLHYSHPEPSSNLQKTGFLRRLSLRPLASAGSTGLSCELRF